MNSIDVVEDHRLLLIEKEIVEKQMQKVNAERAIAIKALQEIEGYLYNAYASEKVVLAYATAVEVLEKLGEDK